MGKLRLGFLVLVALVPVLAIRFQRLDDHSPIIQLFQWPWRDVTQLCSEQFRNLSGMVALQVSPLQPHRIINQPLRDRSIKRPWWERYQPTGLRIGKTRSGTVEEFEEMVRSCSDSGIPIYTEIVINHLLGADAGVGRDSDGDWYSVDGRSFSLKVNGTSSDILINSTETCPKVYRASSTHHCHPVAPYTFGDVPLLKLDITKDTVIEMVVSFITSLRRSGVKGVSIVSAGFSDVSDLINAILPATTVDTDDDMFVYFEIRNESTTPQLRAGGDVTYFSPAMSAEMRTIIHNGATPFQFEDITLHTGMADFFNVLLSYEASVLTLYQATIIGFEHHETNHDRSYMAWGYPELLELNQEQNVIATVVLLLTTPNMGIPRIVWDYESSREDWEGPPRYRNLTVASTSAELPDSIEGSWDQRFPVEWSDWIIPILKFRSQWMGNISQDSVQYPYAEETHSGYLLEHSNATDDDTPIAAFVMKFDKYRLHIESPEPENCTVGILLIPTFVNNATAPRSTTKIQSGRRYFLKPLSYLEVIQLQSAKLCGDNLISQTTLGEQDCVELTGVREVDEDNLEYFTTEIAFTTLEDQSLPFLLFSAVAAGRHACY